MCKTNQNILLIFLLFISLSINAQVKSTQVVSFDLDKRSIGLLPFDERFKLSGFDTKYDEISLTYKINCKYANEEPNYNNGGFIQLVVDKTTGKAIFPKPIEPLHPNVLYDFNFKVSKEIILTAEEEEALQSDIFKLIDTHFEDVKNTDSGEISNFKASLQALLVKYANTDKIVDLSGNLIDITTTPLFKTDLKDVLSNIEKDYSVINSDYKGPNNQIFLAQNNAVSNLNSAVFNLSMLRLKSVLKDEKMMSDSFKAVLNAPINPIPGQNEKLTLRQYLDYIMEDLQRMLSEVINGSVKINGNNHEVVKELDLSSLKLLSNVFEKLSRKSITDNKGGPIFTSDQVGAIKYFKGRIDVVIDKKSNYEARKENIKTAKTKIPNLLKNTIAKKDIQISESIQIDALAEKNAYIGLDAGVGFAFGKANGLFTYQGANFYLRPVNHQTPFSDLKGIDEFWKRFSVYLGIAQIITDEEDQYEALIGDSSVLIGSGIRLTRGVRVNIGSLLHYKKDINPIVDSKKITVSPTFSLSIDINLVKALGAVGGALNL